MYRPDGRTNWLGLIAVFSGLFLMQLDVTIVNVALHDIQASLGGAGLMSWVVDGYTIPIAALMLTVGTLGDRLGNRHLYRLGLLLFLIGSIACAFAPSLPILVATRMIQGLGAAAIAPTSLALIVRAWPEPSAQQRAVGRWAGIGGLGLVMGPLLGGALTSTFGWPSVFAGTALLTLPVLVASHRIEKDPARDNRPIDIPGIGLGSVVLAAAVTWIIQAPAWGVFSLRSVSIAMAIMIGGLCFVEWERRTAHPMLPTHIRRSRPFLTVNTATLLMTFGNTGFLFVYALYLQGVQGFSPFVAGLHLMPLSIGVLIGSLLAHRLIARVGSMRAAQSGFVVEILMMAVLLALGRNIAPVVQIPALLLTGLGTGWEVSAVVAITVGLLPPRDAGLASGIANTSRQLGTALGTAAIGSLYGVGGWHHLVIALVGVIVAFGIASVSLHWYRVIRTPKTHDWFSGSSQIPQSH